MADNDLMGFGVLRALRLARIDVPRGAGVVGVDGLIIGRFITPRPTTLAIDSPPVATPALELAVHAVTLPSGGRRTHRRMADTADLGEST